MSKRIALLIANEEYNDIKFPPLKKPSKDVANLAEILKQRELGFFDEVNTLINQPVNIVLKEIERLFNNKSKDDLLLLFFAGHGVLHGDEGKLYLVVKDTEYGYLNSTAIPANFISRLMDQSFSERIVLILDCCNSGAFSREKRSSVGSQIGTGIQFEGYGYGRFVMTATDVIGYAWEGDVPFGEIKNSVFSHFLINGIKTGAADIDQDGSITFEDLYQYISKQIAIYFPAQKPSRWTYRAQGNSIVLARRKKQETRRPSEKNQKETTPIITPIKETHIKEALFEVYDSNDTEKLLEEISAPYWGNPLERYYKVNNIILILWQMFGISFFIVPLITMLFAYVGPPEYYYWTGCSIWMLGLSALIMFLGYIEVDIKTDISISSYLHRKTETYYLPKDIQNKISKIIDKRSNLSHDLLNYYSINNQEKYKCYLAFALAFDRCIYIMINILKWYHGGEKILKPIFKRRKFLKNITEEDIKNNLAQQGYLKRLKDYLAQQTPLLPVEELESLIENTLIQIDKLTFALLTIQMEFEIIKAQNDINSKNINILIKRLNEIHEALKQHMRLLKKHSIHNYQILSDSDKLYEDVFKESKKPYYLS